MDPSLFNINPTVLLLILAWTIPWKGVALWKAARQSNQKWFIVLLVVNTLAILDILYIFVFSKRFDRASREHSDSAPRDRSDDMSHRIT
ncbi:MAG: DUF5652 family protein [bacterium]|nr:DUF5652 family protein [bacterium]